MSLINPYSRRMTRRLFFIGAGKVILFGGLLLRMYQLQVLEGRRYYRLAEGNRLTVRWVAPPRGQIVDRDGVPLALNQNNFQAVLLTQTLEEAAQTLKSLGQHIDLSALDQDFIFETLKGQNRNLTSFILKKRLSWSEVSLLEVHRSQWPGVTVEVGQTRHYPQNVLTGHVVGYVGCSTKKRRPFIPGFYVGKTGIEAAQEEALQGTPGQRSLEVNAKRRILREIRSDSPRPGGDCVSSLDSRLQKVAMHSIREHKSAAVVALDVRTGEVLAAASYPTFDPNLFVDGISSQAWKELSIHPQTPLLNRAFSGLYAPGSTIKMLVALAALQYTNMTLQTRIHCKGYTTVYGHRFHCWAHRSGGHGSLTLSQALICSCDIFFYEIAKRVSAEQLTALFRLFGLGESFLEDFPNVKSGLVPSPQWKWEKKNQKWTLADTILTAIGQGYMLATPLQLAVMVARLATGRCVCPQYLKAPRNVSFDTLPVHPEHTRFLQDAMAGVVNTPAGTAYRGRIIHGFFKMAGKTGTSQVARIHLKDRALGRISGEGRPWEEQDHALFCGYAPLNQPKYSVAVLVEHGGSGGRVAAPIARTILWETYKLGI